MITKSKRRRLLLLNDLVVCVSVAPRSAEDFTGSERLTLKWTHPVSDIEVSVRKKIIRKQILIKFSFIYLFILYRYKILAHHQR